MIPLVKCYLSGKSPKFRVMMLLMLSMIRQASPSVQKPHCRTHFNWNVEIFLTKYFSWLMMSEGATITHGWLTIDQTCGNVSHQIRWGHQTFDENFQYYCHNSATFAPQYPVAHCPVWDRESFSKEKPSWSNREATVGWILHTQADNGWRDGRYRYLNGFNEP